MDAQTAVLIQNLADKLGTTSEYLWAVLIKQAPISGAVDVAMWAITILVAVAMLRGRKYIVTLTESGMNSHSEAVNFITFIVWLIFAIVAVVWIIACLASIGNVVAAFLNPEYWALDKVLSAAKGK